MRGIDDSKYDKVTKKIVEIFGVVLLALILILQTYNIFSRYTKISPPWMWVEEFTRYSFIWIVFILWFLNDRSETHFVVDVVPNKLPENFAKYLKLFIHILIVIFAAIVVWASIKYIPKTMMYCTQTFRKVPMGVVYMIIPIGLFLAFIERIRAIVGKKWKK